MGKDLTEQLPLDVNGRPFTTAMVDPTSGSVIGRWKVYSVVTENGETVAIPLVAISGGSILLEAGDIEIGAVEIKDATTDTRATVGAGGLYTVVTSGSVTVMSSALPTGAATAANQFTTNVSLASIDGKIVYCNTGSVVVVSSALPAGAATSALQGGGLPAALGAGGGLKIDNSGSALSVNVGAMPTVASSVKISPTGGSKTVATSGSGEALVAVATNAQMLYVRAKNGNTGNVYFGSSTVHKTASPQVILSASQSVSVDAQAGYRLDVSEFRVDVDTAAEGVDFLYVG